jgi:hypothetical protein
MAAHRCFLLIISRPLRVLCRSRSRNRSVTDQPGALDGFLSIIQHRRAAGIGHLGEIGISQVANLGISHLPFFSFCGIIYTRQVVNQTPLS